jgi:hypothetical protein
MFVIITHEIPDALYPHILEIIHGADMSKSNFDYTRRKGMGIFRFSANGVVEQVTLHQSTEKIVIFNGSLKVSIFPVG